jgi:hypothetical protein
MRAAFLGTILLFVSLQTAFARSAGPPTDRNGLNGQYCTVCHRGNDLNAPGGSVSLTGMPSAWGPGNVYTLRVTVAREGAIRFGFEMSAVDPSGKQAGEFIVGADGRTQIVTEPDANRNTVQFIMHTSVGSALNGSNVFEFSYRAPAATSIGNIRFNVAGNATNGNLANTGDFVYAIQAIVPPITVTDTRGFELATRAAISTISGGTGGTMLVGHARVQPNAGLPTPAAMALVSFRPGGMLVSEVALPAVAPLQSGRFRAEVGGGINTGVAIANPGTQTAVVSYSMADDTGQTISSGSVSVAANSQVSAFIDQSPFFVQNPFRPSIANARSFTFNSSSPVGVLAIRGRTNERSDFLMSALPVADLSAATTEAAVIPEFADGGGWTTSVALTNTSDEVATGSVQFISQGGVALTITVDGQSGTQFNYSLPARSSRTLQTSGTGTATIIGSVRVTPASTGRTPLSHAILTSRRNSINISELSVPAVRAGSAFRMYVENSGNFAAGEAGSLQTGFAATNTSAAAVTLNLELTALNGTALTLSGSITVPAQGQIVTFLNQVPGLSSLPSSFQGVLRVSTTTSSSGVSIIGIRARYNERTPAADLIATSEPAVDEAAASSGDLILPHIADAGGYTTQFVLVSSSGAASSGNLRFFDQSGRAVALTLR